MNAKKVSFKILKSFVLIFAIVLNSVAFGVNTVGATVENLSNSVAAKELVSAPISKNFITATQDFSFDVFRESVDYNKNSLISPTSIALAMGMTSNGSDGDTLKQFLQLLTKSQFSLRQLNYFYFNLASILQNQYVDSVYGNPVKLANSIWFADRLNINPNFLQTNATYYKADIFKADFSSPDTVSDINDWIKNKTDGNIDNVIDKVDGNTIMFLINTLLFEEEWENKFDKGDATEEYFKKLNGNYSNGIFFNSGSEVFLQSEDATGFIKPYRGGKYSFVAMLPNEKVSIQDFINNLDALSFESFLSSSVNGETAEISIPKFEYSFDTKLVEPFKRLGFVDAFDDSKANFNKMTTTSNDIYIQDILHKTYIQLSEVGTKAGAVTVVEMAEKATPPVIGNKVKLNRPFVYAIVNNDTNLPIFIGTIVDPFEK